MDSREQLRREYQYEMNQIANNAAKQATKEVFGLLGVNVEDPQQIEEFRKDLRFGGQLRRAADKSFMGFLLTGFVALAAAAWFSIGSKFGGGE